MNSFVYAAIGPIIGGRRTFTKVTSQEINVEKHKKLSVLIYMPKYLIHVDLALLAKLR